MRFFWLFLCALLACTGPLRAERYVSDEVVVSLWTVGPGPDLYAAWGHSALRIQDPVKGIDWVYNYGTFDFATPNFYLKFIRGDLEYLLSNGLSLEVLEEYRDETHQLTVEQILDFTPDEAERLLILLETNLLPANVGYRYDFVRDNCSTRIRDIVAKAVPVKWPPTVKKRTLRQILLPYVSDRPAVKNGIDLLFSSAVDRLPASDEVFFLPQTMEDGFAGAAILDGERTRPLVRKTRTLTPGARFPKRAFDWVPVICWLLAALGFAAAIGSWRWFLWLDVTLFVIVGLAGLFFVLIWTGTRHWVLHGNWNLLWSWPTHLVIWFFPPGVRAFYWRVCAAAMVALVPVYFFPPQYFPTFVPPLLLLLGARAWSRSS